MVFVYDFHPAADTLMTTHFSSPARLNGYTGNAGNAGSANNYPYEGSARPYSADKGSKGLYFFTYTAVKLK